MAAEYSNTAVQTVNPGETVVFTEDTIPCARGFVRHRQGSGNFLLSGWVPPRRTCCCNRNQNAVYKTDFGANIAIPTGGTVEPISIAITLDGSTLPATNMIVTPAAVEEFWNVSRATNVSLFRGCCETLAIRNTSSQPILVQNANIVFARDDLNISY